MWNPVRDYDDNGGVYILQAIGMMTIKLLFLLLILTAGFILGTMFGSFLLGYLNINFGPCLKYLDDAVASYVDLSTLEWNVALQCYITPGGRQYWSWDWPEEHLLPSAPWLQNRSSSHAE